MSTQINHYVVWGIQLPYVKDKHAILEPYQDSAFKTDDINPKNSITVIADGMDCNYTIIGHVVAKTANYGGFKEPVMIPEIPKAATFAIANLCAELGIPLTDDIRIGWIVFTHCR